ncbi:hypothetical protein QJS66_22480 [Kocuria rhizophila]|nr:hypothetical protein QJS66_22480 [Kocuria rhizophila]
MTDLVEPEDPLSTAPSTFPAPRDGRRERRDVAGHGLGPPPVPRVPGGGGPRVTAVVVAPASEGAVRSRRGRARPWRRSRAPWRLVRSLVAARSGPRGRRRGRTLPAADGHEGHPSDGPSCSAEASLGPCSAPDPGRRCPRVHGRRDYSAVPADVLRSGSDHRGRTAAAPPERHVPARAPSSR